MSAISDMATRLASRGREAARGTDALPLRAAIRLAGGVRQVARGAIDALLPPQCLTCDAPVDAPGRLCAPCFRATSFVTAMCCVRCGAPFAYPAQRGLDGLCPTCREKPPEFGVARAALRYDKQARRIVLPFKHGDRVEAARPLAALMARAGAMLLRQADVLVPTPLHRGRLFSRRYNQAALLAQALARLAGRPAAVAALRRVRATAPLGRKSAEERARALQGAFVVRQRDAAMIEGAHVLLIDDVMTSGATANACAAALKAAGALQVDVLVAARVPDPRLEE